MNKWGFSEADLAKINEKSDINDAWYCEFCGEKEGLCDCAND